MTMLRARCRDCDWIWDVVALPLAVAPAAHAMKSAVCPMCGNDIGNLLAPERALTDAERAHKVKVAAIANTPNPPASTRCTDG